MGTWAVHAFGNDDAGDLLGRLFDDGTVSVLEDALSKVALSEIESYLEAPDGQEAIGAAEAIAWMLGRPDPSIPEDEELNAWIANVKARPSAELIRIAVAAIDRVLTGPSELLELWQESDEFEDWKASVLDTRTRIQI